MGLSFIRRKENFVCENCGNKVEGDGYTNHCPNCLCSKHVDIFPGDRKANCGGLMMPVSVELKSGEYIILHECNKCKHKKKNKTSKQDNIEKILEIMKFGK